MILNIESPENKEKIEALRIARLVSRVQEGETEAFGVLYEEHEGRVFRYVLGRVGQVELAEDLTQEVFVRALDNIGQYHDRGNQFSSWLLRIAHNLIIDHYRWTEKRPSLDLTAAQPASSDDPVLEAETRDQIELVLEALPCLSAWQREVISLRFGAGLHLAEAADVMGKSLGAVKTLQHQAIARLRKMMGARGQNQDETPNSKL